MFILPLYRFSNRKTIANLLLGCKYQGKICKCVLFAFNLIEFILEISIIAPVSISYLLQGKLSYTSVFTLAIVDIFSFRLGLFGWNYDGALRSPPDHS